MMTDDKDTSIPFPTTPAPEIFNENFSAQEPAPVAKPNKQKDDE